MIKQISSFLLESRNLTDNDNKGYINFEQKFILPLSFAGAIVSVIGFGINFIAGFNFILLIIPVLTTIFYVTIFYLAKYSQINIHLLKWILFIVTLLIINTLWVFNFGSKGPAVYLFILLYSFMIFMWKGKQLIIISSIVFLNLVILFLIDYYFPNFTGNYPSQQAKIIDVYTALYYYGIIIFIIMYTAKKNYTNAFNSIVKANKLKSSFLANMSHEIKTPLNTILGFSDLLAKPETPPEERKKYMEIIQESNDTLLRLVKDILDISLIESEQLELKHETVFLNQFITNLKETYEYILSEKKNNLLVIETDIPNENYSLVIDGVRLRQVFTNLINNALKFTEEGTITIGYREDKDSLYFFVKDTGIGIPPDKQKQIFERYYQVDKTDKLNKGAGIGLYLTKRIIDLFHGNIGVESKPGTGSTFYFRLPMNEVTKLTKTIPNVFFPTPSAKENKQTLTNKKLKIMLVEDHAYSLILLKNMLKSLNPEIIQAMDGKSAIELFKLNRDTDLIFLDIGLPEKDGYEVIKEIRKIDKNIPVIAETAYAMEKDKDKIYKAGFNGFLPKPLDQDLVMDVIKALGIL